MRSRKLLAAVLCLTAASVGVVEAKKPAASPYVENEALVLDTYVAPNNGTGGTVSTTAPLQDSALYVITVQGTSSAWNPGLWTGEVCAPEASEPAPMFQGSSPLTGPVGADAEFLFSRPRNNGCPQSMPVAYDNFRMSFRAQDAPVHLNPVGGQPAAPTADNIYQYLVVGRGEPATFLMRDSSTSDNYGAYAITVRRASGEDCKKGGWQQFGVFANQGDCVSYFATGYRNSPKGLAAPGSGPLVLS